jgi:hypothetical protein
LILILLLLNASLSFSQWTRELQLPASDITALYRQKDTLYAGGNGIVYFSKDKGQTWDSTAFIPQFGSVDNIISYRNELYAASFTHGVRKSTDGGLSWQQINTGLFPHVSDFAEWNGDLYATTLGGAVFKLDRINRSNWSLFSDGLSDLSLNLTSIAGNGDALIAGTLANGIYDRLEANSTIWEERLLTGQISPSEGVYDMITGHDTLFLAGSTGRLYMSTDNGLSWNIFGERISSTFISLVNAKQAVLLARNSFIGVNNTSFFFIRKNALQGASTPFSDVPDHFSYKLEIFGNKLWDASTNGLFFMPLSLLPEVSDDDEEVLVILPVRFVLVNAKCEGGRTRINWATGEESDDNEFIIEKSIDGNNWTAIGTIPGAGSGSSEKHYSFIDTDPAQNAFYRVKERSISGQIHVSNPVRSMCLPAGDVKWWPAPVFNELNISITAIRESKAEITVFDSRGSLLVIRNFTVGQGVNHTKLDMQFLPAGAYEVVIRWDGGNNQKTARVLKQ